MRDPEECAMAYLPGFDICAGDPPAEDACYGDSGGPLLVREGDAWAQVGVVSRSASAWCQRPTTTTTP